MFITNCNSTYLNTYLCKKAVAKYLMNKGFPLLSRKDNVYIFTNTESLQKALSDAPIWIKILI